MNAPNMPNNQPIQNNQNNKKKSGLPCGLIAVGCGCLTILLLIIAGIGGFFMYSSVSSGPNDDEGGILSILGEEGGIVDMIRSGADKSSSPGKDQSKSEQNAAKNSEKKAKEEMKNAISPEKIRGYMKKPLSKKDINAHHKFMSDWAKDPAQIEYIKATQNAEKLGKASKGKEGSVADTLKTVNAGAKVMTAMTNVSEAFDKYIIKNGGYEEYYGRVVRIGGIVAASKTVTGANKTLKNSDSDAVSKQMLKERPEVAKEYSKNFEDAKKELAKAKKAGSENSSAGLGALMTMGQGPGTVALARMPEQSFKTWDSLSEKQRKAVRESLDPKEGFGGWFGVFSVNPSMLLVSATMAELEQLQEK